MHPTKLAILKNPCMFPVRRKSPLDKKEEVPLAWIMEHSKQIRTNHKQTMNSVIKRGGLTWCEIWAVVNDKPWEPEPRARELVLDELNRIENEGMV